MAPLLLLLLAACGAESGPAGTASHDSPEGAVRGLVDALARNDARAAADWILPAERDDFSGGIDEARSLGLRPLFSVRGFAVESVQAEGGDGNRAQVRYAGSVSFCLSGSAGGKAVNNCSAVQSQSGAGSADVFVCVRQGGGWYVSIAGRS